MRAGDFSAFGTTIYDPATGNPDGTGRTPFPGNIIPANRISPISQQLQARLPMPNRAGTSGNYSGTGPIDLTRNNFDVKLNYNVSSSAQIWAKYSQMNATVESDMWLGNPQDGGAGGYGFGDGSGVGDTKVKLGTLGMSWSLSPNLVLDGTLGMTRFDQECMPPDIGTNFGTDVFGIPGTNGDGLSGGDPRTSGMPSFRITGYEPFGNVDGWTPLYRNDRSYNVSTNLTWIAGKHEMRFGIDVVKLELNHWQPELGDGPRGPSTSTAARPPWGRPAHRTSSTPTPSSCSGSTLHPEVRPVRDPDRSGVAVWPLLPRPLAGQQEPDPQPRPALGEVPAHDARRSRHRVLGRHDEQGAPGRPRGQPGGPGGRGQAPAFPASDRRGLPHRGRQRDPRRIRHHRQPAAAVPAAARLLPAPPSTSASRVPTASCRSEPSRRASPTFGGPDLSTGVVDLPATADEATHTATTSTAATSSPGTYPTSAGCRRTSRWPTSYVGTMTTSMMGSTTSTRRGRARDRPASRSSRPSGAPLFRARYDGYLSSNYHSLQVALNRPFTKGFFVKGAYTWSKAMNRQDDDGWATVDWNQPSVLCKNYGPAGFDRAHVFQLGFVAELPFGKDGIGRAQRDRQGLVAQRAVQLRHRDAVHRHGLRRLGQRAGEPADGRPGGNPQQAGRDRCRDPYYDPSAWAPVTEVRFGNTGRNTVRGPSWTNLDLSLFRRFPIKKVTLEARVEAFNVTNTPHFNNPTTPTAATVPPGS